MRDFNKPIIISGAEICTEQVTGIPRYMFEVITRLDKLLERSNLNIDIRICYPSEMELKLPELSYISKVPLEQCGKKWQTQILKKYVTNQNGIFIGMANNICLTKNSIICLHDIRPLVCKKYDSFFQRFKFALIALSVKMFSCNIVTVSETQKNLIRKTLKISTDNIEVIPNGWEHMKKIVKDNSIFEEYPMLKEKEYFYTLGSIALHKNYKWVLEVAKRNPNMAFVVAGGQSLKKWKTDASNIRIENIIYVGYVSDEKNKALMANCKAFLHPAKFEGFGIPPLEALSLGKQIVVANTSCLPEIYGKSAHYFDPDNYNVNLDNMLKEPVEPSIDVLEKYTWEHSAQLWFNLIEKTIKSL